MQFQNLGISRSARHL